MHRLGPARVIFETYRESRRGSTSKQWDPHALKRLIVAFSRGRAPERESDTRRGERLELEPTRKVHSCSIEISVDCPRRSHFPFLFARRGDLKGAECEFVTIVWCCISHKAFGSDRPNGRGIDPLAS